MKQLNELTKEQQEEIKKLEVRINNLWKVKNMRILRKELLNFQLEL